MAQTHPADHDDVVRPAPAGYTKVPHALLSDPNLGDEAFRLLLALKSFAWDRDHCWASNPSLARRCGWFTPGGKPSVSKVKRLLRLLEAEGHIRREVARDGNRHRRERITIAWPKPPAIPGSNPTNTRVKNDPPPGSEMVQEENSGEEKPGDRNQGARSKSAHAEITLLRCDLPEGGEEILGDDPDASKARGNLLRRLDRLGRPPRSRRGHGGMINRTAKDLAAVLFDDHSHARYCKALWGVVRGDRPAEDVVVAFDAAAGLDAARRPREPGPYFFGVLDQLAADRACAEVEEDIRLGRAADHAGRAIPGPQP